MQTRQLGSTDLQLTTLGLGTWAIGGGDWKFGWGDQDESQAVQAILHAVECGMNWIDTAAVYGDGRSEEIVGKAISELPVDQRPIIATKCGRIVQEDGNIIGRIKADSIVRECEASLQRLGVECIDLYQLHWPDPDADIEEAWEAMRQLTQQGKVRHLGVSNHSVEQMERLRPIASIASLQPPYSMIARDVEQKILPYCAEHKIGVVCYSPMGKGLLTGSFSRERAAALPENDHRSRDPKFQSPLLEINLEFVEALEPIATRHGRRLAELALAWVLRRSEVTSAIVGARRPDQIDGVVNAADWTLSEEDLSQIEQLLSRRDQQLATLGSVDTGRV